MQGTSAHIVRALERSGTHSNSRFEKSFMKMSIKSDSKLKLTDVERVTLGITRGHMPPGIRVVGLSWAMCLCDGKHVLSLEREHTTIWLHAKEELGMVGTFLHSFKAIRAQ